MSIWIEVLFRVVPPIVTFGMGWIANKKLADGTFLRNEVYSPLYEEIKMMHENILEFKDCFNIRYGRPDYSAPLPPNKVPGSVRKYLLLNGQYHMLSNSLSSNLDTYYSKCTNEWNELIAKHDIIHDLSTGKLVDVQVKDQGRKLCKTYSDRRGEESSTINGEPIYSDYKDIKNLSESEIKQQLTILQKSLQSDSESLISQLEQRIRNPNPLRSLLSFKR